MAKATSRRAGRRQPVSAGGTPPRPRQTAPLATPASSRTAPLLILIGGALLLLVGAGALFFTTHPRSQQLAGPTIADTPPAPDFALADQNGQHVQLAALRGKVVALTFLYTQCPDVCPLIGTKLAQGDQQLGRAADQAALLAVSVDPADDTPAAVRAFDQSHGLVAANWHYLLGSAADLAPVWKSYFVGTDAAEVPGAAAAKVSTPTPQLVNHTAIVYLIDPKGRLRIALDANFSVGDFVQDVRTLLSE